MLGKCCCHLHFTDEESEGWEVGNFPRAAELEGRRARPDLCLYRGVGVGEGYDAGKTDVPELQRNASVNIFLFFFIKIIFFGVNMFKMIITALGTEYEVSIWKVL